MKKQYVTPKLHVEHFSTEEVMLLNTSTEAGDNANVFSYSDILGGLYNGQ